MQDHGFGGGGAEHGSGPWFCEGGDHAGAGDQASSNVRITCRSRFDPIFKVGFLVPVREAPFI